MELGAEDSVLEYSRVTRMADFGNSVFKVFRQLQDEFGFVAACGGQDFASLVRPLSDDIVLYLFVHDDRAGDSRLPFRCGYAPRQPR